jgi:hypothetical protein
VTDQPQIPEPDSVTSVQPVSGSAGAPAPDGGAQSAASDGGAQSTASGGGAQSAVSDRPEIAVGGAFAGGFLLAMILKRLAR